MPLIRADIRGPAAKIDYRHTLSQIRYRTVTDLGSGSELTAGAVNLLTPGIPDRRGDAVRAKPLDKGVLHPRIARCPFRARCRIQRDRVDVHPASPTRGQQLAEKIGTPF